MSKQEKQHSMKRVLGIILIFIGVLVYLFFRNYDGTFLPYPALWFFVGLILIAIGIRLLFFKFLKRSRELKTSLQEEIMELKLNGDRIQVDLKECEILSNHYYKEVLTSSNSRIQAWDALYNKTEAVEHVEVNQSRIACKVNYLSDEMMFMSPVIHKDKITLSFLLDKYKSTTIYVDKKDPDRFYFDLEFLEN